jgi:hypothetical protein
MAIESKLTAKQQRFVDEYLIDLNATQAAIRAGYSFMEVPVIGYYTYLLIDPRSGSVFYVGKGKGNRLSMHARRAALGHIDNAQKHKIITQVTSSGLAVREVVFSVHEKEADAYITERALIKAFKNCGIANVSGGIVTNDERRELSIMWTLNRIKPYREWIRSATDAQLRSAVLIGGTPFIAYMKIRLHFLELLREARCSR